MTLPTSNKTSTVGMCPTIELFELTNFMCSLSEAHTHQRPYIRGLMKYWYKVYGLGGISVLVYVNKLLHYSYGNQSISGYWERIVPLLINTRIKSSASHAYSFMLHSNPLGADLFPSPYFGHPVISTMYFCSCVGTQHHGYHSYRITFLK